MVCTCSSSPLRPWPVLLILVLLCGVAGVASMVLRRGGLLLAASVLAGIVLLVFEAANRWPLFPGSHFVGCKAGEERSGTPILHQIRRRWMEIIGIRELRPEKHRQD